jgi:cytochrome c
MIRRAAFALSLSLALSACGSKDDAAEDTVAPVTETAGSAVAVSGEAVFKKCVACHTIDKGGRNGVGPNLHGIVGKAVAASEGYSYSAAMNAKGGAWDTASLDAYLENPRKAMVGTKMSFAGIPDAAERKALIEYLAAQK